MDFFHMHLSRATPVFLFYEYRVLPCYVSVLPNMKTFRDNPTKVIEQVCSSTGVKFLLQGQFQVIVDTEGVNLTKDGKRLRFFA